MSSSDESSSRRDFEDARSEALDVLLGALRWQLTDDRWQKMQPVLDEMKSALEAADAPALMTATAQMELFGPVRISRIGATGPVPPPISVRDGVNLLVHELEGTARQEDPKQTRADDDDTSCR
jgi:hypothetical protein